MLNAENSGKSSYALGVDIGGTFTDVVLRDASGGPGSIRRSTPESLDIGFFRAVDTVLTKAAIKPAAVSDVVVHAATFVTNAVIERKGPSPRCSQPKGSAIF